LLSVAPSQVLPGSANRVYAKVDPDSPSKPPSCNRSRMPTTWAKGPGSSGGPGSCAFRSFAARDQFIFADSSSDDLRHYGVINWANDRNNIIT
jgi:hypothetical protein